MNQKINKIHTLELSENEIFWLKGMAYYYIKNKKNCAKTTQEECILKLAKKIEGLDE